MTKIEAMLDGLNVNLPQEPMTVGPALFALDRARKQDAENGVENHRESKQVPAISIDEKTIPTELTPAAVSSP